MARLVKAIAFSYTFVEDSTTEFSFLFSEELDDEDFKVLESNKWIKLHQITPRAYVFMYNGTHGNLNKSLDQVKIKFEDKIIDIESVKCYASVYEDIEAEPEDEEDSNMLKGLNNYNLVCDKYYGMGIEDAWSLGYSGKGVKVAVTDIGINTDLKDLQENIEEELCINLIDETTNVAPERLHSYQDAEFLDHGNRCASVIAAEKGNDICSAGIAFNATIIAVKMFVVVDEDFPLLGETTTSALMARSQIYKLGTIDIYSNSWGPETPFTDIAFIQRVAIDISTTEGRKGLGAIHVFPVSLPGNGLANHEHTIAVSAVGPNGTVPTDFVISSSVLTAGLRDGNNISANSMVTTSYGDKCVSSFKGVSAATAQVAGVIALALEAQPLLTLADIQDLLVYSSDVNCLDRSENITLNAAGLKFHGAFGFGLINASKLVRMAKYHKTGLRTSSVVANQISSCKPETNYFVAEFCYSCRQSSNNSSALAKCLNTLKTIKLEVKYETTSRYIKMILTSPSGTRSTLQDVDAINVVTNSGGRIQILTSVHFWDESGFGIWRLEIHSAGKVDVIGNVSLTLFGLMSEHTFDDNLLQNCKPTCPTSPVNDVPSSPENSTILIIIIISVAIVFLLITGVVAILLKHTNSSNNNRSTRSEEENHELDYLRPSSDDE